MIEQEPHNILELIKSRHPEKFPAEESVFSHIHPGNRIFIGTGCGEPQYLVSALIKYVQSHPKAFFDTELLQVWTLGVAPYADAKFKDIFRHNSFFIGSNTREAVNRGIADYTPIFLSQVPALFQKKLVPVDVALIQASLPDKHGYMSLGISVDIVKAATENAALVIAQTNARMPRVLGDTFINIRDVDFVIPHDEQLLEFEVTVSDEIAQKIGHYVARIVQDGDTIQVGYGSIPNAILAHLEKKEHLGVHTELLTDGIVDLMKKRVIDNTKKELNPGKTVAAFCMGKQDTYDYLHDNPAIEFRPVNYTNNPTVLARQRGMTAINSALEIDLSGQATAESIGKTFYSGIGGQADFMRGAILSPGGKTILALQSTAEEGTVSRIVPFLREGAGVTLSRGDIHYVVTEYGIAYLHGKNIRERAMELIAIAHPEFRQQLIEQARERRLIYKDQAFIPGVQGEYPADLETYKTTRTGLRLMLRPVKMSDEHLLKDFFYSLSNDSMYKRFISIRQDMHHDRLQPFVVIDYTREMVILAVLQEKEREMIVGMAQYIIDENSHTAEVAFVVRDDHQGKGIGAELLKYVTYIARKSGLLGFTAAVLMENRNMLQLFEKMGFFIEKHAEAGMYDLKMSFRDRRSRRS
ncbi:MAG TPA: GNAT family N-acetyltransferase [Nitrospirota bacterium]|nr:GNAT family N-acetyltransferase [Nitrospirota bacterium]